MVDVNTENERFLKDLVSERLASPVEEFIQSSIVGNYNLKLNDVAGEVIDWVLHYLEQRHCPYSLSVFLAKSVAEQISAFVQESALQGNENSSGDLSNSLSLHSEAIKKLHGLCSEYLNNLEQLKMSTSVLCYPYIASVFAIRNKRRKMEDRHVILHNLNSLLNLQDMPLHSYYAVFDGHAGIDAASFAAAHLHVNIAHHPKFLTDTELAIKEAFKLTDDQFREKAVDSDIKSGCTAVCALIRENKLYLAWLGDSQALLVKQGHPITIMDPHKPDREDERKRIETLGGFVCHVGTWRVNGSLAVSRALGDFDHKPFISSEPEVNVISLDGTEDFLILACDGLWDGMSPADVSATLYKNLAEGSDDPQETVAEKLVAQSKSQGSDDNITTIVVFLKSIESLKLDAPKYSSVFLQLEGMQSNIINGKEEMILEYTESVNFMNSNNTNPFHNYMNENMQNPFQNNVYGSLQRPQTLQDDSDFHNLNTEFNESLNVISGTNFGGATGLPPEATALSELPTPPIDDVIGNQQFATVTSEDQLQKLHSHLENPETKFEDLHQSNNKICENEEPLLVDLSVSVSQIAADSEIKDKCEPCISKTDFSEQIEMEFAKDLSDSSKESITREEVMNIASDVVASTIETAVKSVDSEIQCSSDMEIMGSPQKLNPYAEPFVMPENLISPEADIKSKDSLFQDSHSHISELDHHSGVTSAVVVTRMSATPENLMLVDITDQPLPSSEVDSELKKSSEIFSSSAFQMKEIKQTISELENSAVETSDVLPEAPPSITEYESVKIQAEEIKYANTENLDFSKSAEILQTVESNLLESQCSHKVTDSLSSELTSVPLNEQVQSEVVIDSVEVDKENFKVKVPSEITESDVSKNVILSQEVHEKLLETSPDQVLLAEDSHEEQQVSVSAVDLHAILDGLPEAEGVTEDSDSEKDGGWSYVKGSGVSSQKKSVSDRKTSDTKTKKVADKTASTNLKTKEKLAKDIVGKTKTSNIAEKYKKPTIEKKGLEPKEKPVTEKKTLISKEKVKKESTDKEKIEKKTSEVKSRPLSSVKSTTQPLASKLGKTTVPSSSINKTLQSKPVESSVQKKTVSGVTNRIQKPPALLKTQSDIAKATTKTSTARTSSFKSTTARPATTSLAKTTKCASSNIASQPGEDVKKTKNISTLQKIPSRPSSSVASRTMPKNQPVNSKTNVPNSSVDTKTLKATSILKKSQSLEKRDMKEVKNNVNKQIAGKSVAQPVSQATKVPFTTSTPKATAPMRRIASNTIASTSIIKGSKNVTKSSKSVVEKTTVAAKTTLKFEKAKEKIKEDPNKVIETNNASCDPEKKLVETSPGNEVEEKFQLEEHTKEVHLDIQTATLASEHTISAESGGPTTIEDQSAFAV